MTIFYSALTGGFYDDSIHSPAEIPVDAFEITDAEHQTLLEGQGSGKRIVSNELGQPVLEEPAPPSLEALIAAGQQAIDRRFEELYYMSVPNTAIAAEYDAAYMATKAWLNDTSKPVPERIKALGESYGVNDLQAAQIVVQKWTEAQAVAFDRRGAARLRAKAAIRAAQTAAQVAEALAAGEAAMEAVSFEI